MSLSLSISDLRAAYSKGLHVEALIIEVLRRIEKYDDPAVWVSRFTADDLINRSRTLDALSPGQKARLPLFGIPFAVKDNIDCAGLATTAGCPAFSYMPARSAEIVQKLVDAGAIPIGKTNLDQFATGLVGTRSPYGAPRSVFNKEYISGGSSSGSAVAVAAGLVSFALGTDTAGSGRVPAAFNNIVGLKPSRGIISTHGVVPACHSLDCVSIFVLNIEDAASVFDIVAGDQTFSSPNTNTFRFAVPRSGDLTFFNDATAQHIFEQAVTRLQGLGGQKREIDYAPFADAAALLYNGAFVAERYEAVGSFIEAHAHDTDAVVSKIILEAKDKVGRLPDDLQKLAQLRQQADQQLADCDVLLLPTTPTIYRVDEIAEDPIRLNARLGTYTNFMNLFDMCGLALPAGIGSNGLAYGVTLAAAARSEAKLFSVGSLFEKALNLKPGGPQLQRQDHLDIAVVGAHMSGLPLNHELTSRGAQFIKEDKTAACYKLFALPGGPPFRPGLIRADEGASIALEIWRLPVDQWGSFMRGVPRPLCIGTLELADGSHVLGFLCENFILQDAQDITSYGGWRRYLAGKIIQKQSREK